MVRPPGKPGREADDFPPATVIGGTIASRMLATARAKGVVIGLDLGPDFHDLDARGATEVAEQLTRIGRVVRESLMGAIEADGQDDLARDVGHVRSANVQLGPALKRVPLH